MNSDRAELEVMRLAAIGLAITPGGVERWLAHHRVAADGRCGGCGRAWRCRYVLIAHSASALVEAAMRAAPPAVWEDVVPPVLGLGDEW